MAKRIEVSDLDIFYGNFKAVEQVNMSIEPRTITALIGPSGCGKSTFLRSLNRMHEVIPGARVTGKVVMDGENLYGAGVDPVTVRRHIGMVFQRPNPFPTMSIFYNVVAGVRLNGGRMRKSALNDLVEET
nr:ATP-binding cassette domain-containing protein [Micromonospora sp. DSM 115978]